MKTFLKSLAYHVVDSHGEDLDELCLVFPNRRAGLFFKKYFSSIKDKPGWFPEILTIGDLMNRLSGLEPADALELSFDIYKAYKEVSGTKETIDDFYPWGEVMISDFDDIDKYLVDPSALFTNIKDLREIDNVFDFLDEDQKKLIQKFWNSFISDEVSNEKEAFLNIWKVLFPVYKNFKNRLKEKGIAYEGMIYRKVAEETINDPSFILPWKKVLLCGFNALSKSETLLFNHLKNNGTAEFYWDFDEEYIEDPVHEAGRFLRRNIEKFPREKGFDPGYDNLSAEKNVGIISLPSDVLQAKELFRILKFTNDEKNLAAGLFAGQAVQDFNHTAVILGDESLLPPVLMSLPGEIEKLNITMGFPVSQTPVFSFVEAILRLQENFLKRSGNPKFYYRDILTILNHQYVKSFYGEQSNKYIEEINRKNMIYLTGKSFEDDSLFKRIFRRINSIGEMVNYMTELFDAVELNFPKEDPSFQLEREYIFHIRTRLNKLRNLIEEEETILTLDSFSRLFRKILLDFRIPFEGEPLQGTQFMGILESRLLDFRNVVFLSMNEGVMPASSHAFTYIPANLRFAFDLPVKEDKDAIYSYYFYRLLQRAENIHILYNNQTEGVKSGEPSRYIHQIEYLSKWNPSFDTISFKVIDKKPVKITIEKSDEVMTVMDKYLDNESEHYLSPSALTSFMDCSLRFYFSYIAGLKEEDEVSEDIDASVFGSLYHKAMELVYANFRNEEISAEIIDQISSGKNIKKHMDQAFREEFLKNSDPDIVVKPEGRNIIIYEIIQKMVLRTLFNDRSAAPFVFKETEQNIKRVFLDTYFAGSIQLGGKIDRLDTRNGILHLLDYKTGRASLNFSSLEHVFNRDNWNSQENLKAIFQTFMYAWLYSKLNKDIKAITPGIYLTRELFKDDFSVNITDKSRNSKVFNYFDYASEFEERLKALLALIFNRDIPFSQTADEDRCKYCVYREICHR